jgi:hypothetical protein
MTTRRTLLQAASASGALGVAGAIAPTAALSQFGRRGRGPGLVRLSTPEAAVGSASSISSWSKTLQVETGRRILRPILSVQVITDESAEVNDRMGGARNAGVNIQSKYAVVGLDNAGIQTAVDGLYAAYQRQLMAAGYEFVPEPEVLAHARGSRIFRGGAASGTQMDLAGGGKATFFAPQGDTLHLFGSIDFGFGVLRQQWGASAEPAMDRFHAIQDLRAGIVGMHLVVRFVDIQTWGGGQYSHLFTEGSGSIRMRGQVAFAPVSSALYVFPSDPFKEWNMVALTPMAALPTSPITEFADVTSRGAQVDALLGTALSALAGGSRSYERKEYRITVDQGQFVDGLTRGGEALSAAFISRLSQPMRRG